MRRIFTWRSATTDGEGGVSTLVEASPWERHRWTVVGLLLFAATLLVLLVGIRVSGWIEQEQSRIDNVRLSMNALVNNVREIDSLDCVAVGSGPEGEALVLLEHLSGGTYETRLYLYQGHLVQEYAVAGTTYHPETAVTVADTTTFAFGYADGLLTMSTDEGTAEVALRSTRGGE